MKTDYRRSPIGSMMPGYSTNAVLRLIIICGVGYVGFLFTAVCYQAFGLKSYPEAVNIILPYIALPAKSEFASHFWTVFIYGWSNRGFWDWLSDMVWLFCFGSVVQSLIGYKNVIPIFFYGFITGGIFYILCQFIPGAAFIPRSPAVLGAQAGVMALAVACITIAPRYRYFLGPNFSIPMIAILAIFITLMLLRVNLNPPMLFMLAGGASLGFLYVKLTQRGYKLGDWVYNLGSNLERWFTPVDDRPWKTEDGKINQNLVDELLDKINQKGMRSLSKEEKKLLERIGKQGN